MKKVKNVCKKSLILLTIVASVYFYNRYKSVAHPVDIPENSFLHQLAHIDVGQSEQEVERILGEPQKTYPFKSECIKDSYTYKRWTDKVTQSSVQLFFDPDKRLSFIMLKNGNTLLDLKTLAPQYNFSYVIGSSHLTEWFNNYKGVGALLGENVIISRFIRIKKQESKTEDSAYFFMEPYGSEYFNKHIASTSLGITKDISLFDCEPAKLELNRDKRSIPLSSILFNDRVLKFEMKIRPKPFIFPVDNVMKKLGNINLGQSPKVVTEILGAPDKQMEGEFKRYQSNKKIPYTYMRWADEETGSNVQLLFDKSHRLTLIVVHKGYMNLDLQALFPQYNVPFVLGKSTKEDFYTIPIYKVGGKLTKLLYKNTQYESGADFHISSKKTKNGLVYILPHSEYAPYSEDVPWSPIEVKMSDKSPRYNPIRVFSLSNNLQLFEDSDSNNLHYHEQMDATLLGVLVSFPPEYFERWDELSCHLKDGNGVAICKNYPFMR